MTHKSGLHNVALDVGHVRADGYKKGYSAKKEGPLPHPKKFEIAPPRYN